MNPSPNSTSRAQTVFILAGSSSQYSEARRKLGLAPGQAFWLTRPSDLKGRHRPQVYRFGTWKDVARIREIEAALETAEAEITDVS